MGVTMRMSDSLKHLTRNKTVIVFESGYTIADCLNNLNQEFPAFKEQLYDQNGNLKAYVTIFLNGYNINYHKGVDTMLNEGDELDIIPTAAGG
ncbi:MAG: MoaD family protein [Clostridia bacterium]|nr:MoaD family protein [Clostridia bacterium]